jgi:hypothetical protein
VAILDAAFADKKVRGGQLRCAMPSAIGTMARGAEGFGLPLDEATAAGVLAEMLVPAA